MCLLVQSALQCARCCFCTDDACASYILLPTRSRNRPFYASFILANALPHALLKLHVVMMCRLVHYNSADFFSIESVMCCAQKFHAVAPIKLTQQSERDGLDALLRFIFSGADSIFSVRFGFIYLQLLKFKQQLLSDVWLQHNALQHFRSRIRRGIQT